MAEQITLGDFGTLQNSTIIATLNANNTIIENAFLDCLSLAGTLPNQMQSNLDMNSFQIINLPAPATLNSAVRLIDLEQAMTGQSSGAFGLLNGNNTWLGTNTFTNTSTFSGTANLNGTINIAVGTTGQLYWNNADVLSATTNLKYAISGDILTNTNNAGQFVIGSNATSNGAVFAITRTLIGGSTHGFDDVSTWQGGTGLAYASFSVGSFTTGSNNLSHVHAYQASPTFAGTGTLTEFSMYNSSPNFTSAGTITNLYHLQIADVSPTGGGAVTNNYGVFMGNLSTGTNNYGVYQVGTNVINYFNGTIGINTTTPGTGGLNVNVNIDSSSTTTGAIRVLGGIGVGMSMFIGGRIVLPATTSATVGVLRVGATNFLHGLGTSNVFIGGAGNFSATPGTRLVGIGSGAIGVASQTGNDCTGIGFNALNACTTAAQNTAIGSGAGSGLTTGGQNTIIGYNSGGGITTGTQNTIIGANVGSLSSSLAGCILFATGAGTIFLDYNKTTTSVWTSTKPISVSDTTASTSTTTGAMITAGGHAVAGTVWSGGGRAQAAPSTQAGTSFSTDLTHYCYICTSASAVTVTLPAASSNTGFIYLIKQTGAGAVSSATSNIVPLAGGAAGTAITAGAAKWAYLQSDGTSWIILASN